MMNNRDTLVYYARCTERILRMKKLDSEPDFTEQQQQKFPQRNYCVSPTQPFMKSQRFLDYLDHIEAMASFPRQIPSFDEYCRNIQHQDKEMKEADDVGKGDPHLDDIRSSMNEESTDDVAVQDCMNFINLSVSSMNDEQPGMSSMNAVLEEVDVEDCGNEANINMVEDCVKVLVNDMELHNIGTTYLLHSNVYEGTMLSVPSNLGCTLKC